MKKLFFVVAFFCGYHTVNAQQSSSQVLYGAISRSDLRKVPFARWFDSTYDAYNPSAEVISRMKKRIQEYEIEIFLGTWCGDSRREVPRFLKVLRLAGLPDQQLKLIALGGDSLYKQSPQHEEAGKSIFRVPVFVVYKQGGEVGRINEFPVYTLERDLEMLLDGEKYSPNYRSFTTVQDWLTSGVLTDKNVSIRGLALLIKPNVFNDRELNSLGHLLLAQDKPGEALGIFQVNALLFPESVLALTSLGEGLFRNNENLKAIQTWEKALELKTEPVQVKDILKKLYTIKGLKN